MEDNGQSSLFKTIDKSIFEKIDGFRSNPNYNLIQDYYNGLEEEQQKVFKFIVLLVLIVIPLMLLGTLFWQNSNLREELQIRTSLIEKAREIVGQRSELNQFTPQIVASNAIDEQTTLTSRLSGLLSTVGIDLSKVQVSNFEQSSISPSVVKAEADFGFMNVTTDELMNIFTVMIQKEKFKISSVDIKRNTSTGLLMGSFHAIHFGAVGGAVDEEE